MDKAWLKNRVTLEELRSAPGGAAYFERLLGQLREGDELWQFCSSPDSWASLAGRAGVALVRAGAVVDSVITIMN